MARNRTRQLWLATVIAVASLPGLPRAGDGIYIAEMSNSDQVVSVSRVIAADAATIFAIIDNPSRHAEMDGSGTVRGSSADTHLMLGESFGVDMKMGVPYKMSSKVVEYEKDRLIAWAHFGKHRWRYELEPVDGGTKVTESFDWSTSFFAKGIELMGYPTRHPAAMTKTLERLDALATAEQ